MKTAPPASAAAPRTQPLVWAAMAISILICVVISYLHIEQRNALGRAISSLDTLRQARVDLAEGFLQVSFADQPGLPFDRAQGMALIRQALDAISEHADRLDPSGESLAAYQRQAEQFEAQIAAWGVDRPASPRETAAMQITFHQLEIQATQVDAESRDGLRRLTQRLDLTFTLFLSVAAILLAGVCAVIFGVGRAQAQAEQRRAQAERALQQLNGELERRVAERTAELERANHAKSAFLAGMSHELRTPLNAVLGFTGTLLMQLPGPLNADQERQLSTIQRSARHLLALINDILDLARIESGRVELSLGPTVCQEVIAEVVADLRHLADQKGLALTMEAPEQPVVARADRRALSQILINLVGNAIKFTDRGTVTIALDSRDAAGGRQILIRVRDSGIGIREGDLPRLFQEFGRVSSADVHSREGTGLGLRLSQQLAGLLGGQIEVQSTHGAGSTFTLALPAC